MKNPHLKFFLLLFIHFSFSIALPAQEKGELLHRVYLIGDTGEDLFAGKTLKGLQNDLLADSNSTVIFLGDNVYPKGVRKALDIYNPIDLQKLTLQLDLLQEYKGNMYFIPGNHDWHKVGKKGYETLLNQAIYLEEYVKEKDFKLANLENGVFLPKPFGTPGPVKVVLPGDILLILIDTEWLIHKSIGMKVGVSTEETSIVEEEKRFWKDLEEMISGASQREIMFVAHHPMFSIGEHGSKSNGPDAGNALSKRLKSQELYGRGYNDFRQKALQIINKSEKSIIYAAGHEHNLQYWNNQDEKHFIVSGAGSKHTAYYPKVQYKRWNLNLSENPDQAVSLIYPKVKKKVKGKHVETGYFIINYYESGEKEIIMKDSGMSDFSEDGLLLWKD
ncbi:metallophosphoesterase [Flexithrix dorotheae]|uniref:metallophosphoesterase n=1 Tax=Flexithrix dorotheae TaxID=70993 RepID=UPI00036C88DA|nr:metallophosphoesterase [Flexithrix dorotheae]